MKTSLVILVLGCTALIDSRAEAARWRPGKTTLAAGAAVLALGAHAASADTLFYRSFQDRRDANVAGTWEQTTPNGARLELNGGKIGLPTDAHVSIYIPDAPETLAKVIVQVQVGQKIQPYELTVRRGPGESMPFTGNARVQIDVHASDLAKTWAPLKPVSIEVLPLGDDGQPQVHRRAYSFDVRDEHQ